MTNAHLTALFFAQIAFILVACRLVGIGAHRVGQPQVVAEMVAGFLIGPSLFGWLAPAVQAQLFPSASMPTLYVVSQTGLALYMFCVGLDFSLDFLVRHARRAASVSIAGIVVPFGLGAALALMMFRGTGFFAPGVQLYQAVLFIGAAMSITAFPMLARIIYERGIAGTAVGTLTLAAGAMDDAAAWVMLAVVLGSFTDNALLGGVAAGGGLLYLVIVWLVVRPLLLRFDRIANEQGEVPPWMFSVILALLAGGAWFTDVVGIHSVFGAFVLGAFMPRGLLARALQDRIEPLTTTLLVPIFFVYSGLNSSLGLVNSAWLWIVTILIFVAACAGKGIACYAAARFAGSGNREALAVATLMNARGMMELILLNIGLQRGLITPTLFTMLVMMAIGTTLMAGPLFSYVSRREAVPARDANLGSDAPA